MTEAEARFWEKVMSRARLQRPAMQGAIMRMIERIQNAITPGEVEKLLASGANIDAVVAALLDDRTMDLATADIRSELMNVVQRSAAQTVAEIPAARQAIRGAFNVLDPRVIESIRRLDTKVAGDLRTQALRVVRAEGEAALRLGLNPRAVAARLRDVVGLGENGRVATANYRKALESGDATKALNYLRRNRRYDAMTRRGGLSEAQINRMVDAYRARFIGLNAEAVARTAVLDANKAGQEMAIRQAIESGFLKGDRMVKTWVTVGDERVRDEHVEMADETVPWNEPFSNGEMVPGESTYNCRCVPRYTQDKEGRPSVTGPRPNATDAIRRVTIPRSIEPVRAPVSVSVPPDITPPAVTYPAPVVAQEPSPSIATEVLNVGDKKKPLPWESTGKAKQNITALFGKDGVRKVKEYADEVYGTEDFGFDGVRVSDAFNGAFSVTSKGSYDNSITRTFSRNYSGRIEVHHDFFRLSEALQGKGLGSKLIDESFKHYDKLGVEEVTLYANLSVGGYAWARMGFAPNTSYSWNLVKQGIQRRLDDIRRMDPMNDTSDIAAMLKSDDPKTIWRIADSRWGETLLKGGSWDGSFELKDVEARARLARSLARAKAKLLAGG